MQSDLLADPFADPGWVEEPVPTRRSPRPDVDQGSGADRMEAAQEFFVDWEVPEA